MTARVRFGQIGVRHGHAAGKWRALLTNPAVDQVGIYEPDPARRHDERFAHAKWFESADDLLAHCDAVAIEVRNHQSLAMAQQAVDHGKHLWFDKPAGDDWPAFESLIRAVESKNLYLQMGYMFRYSPGFERIVQLAHSTALGQIFQVRAHMSTHINLQERSEQSRHRGGILYDLSGHMLDQIVWLLGRPHHVESVLRNDATPELPTYSDNSLAILEFEHTIATIDIAAMEPAPTARRFEVYGDRGSIVLDGFDPARSLRIVLDGAHTIESLPPVERQQLYDRELEAFLGVLNGTHQPDRPLRHERIVQQTLLRATGSILAE